MALRTASCSCGQLTAITSGEPLRVSICHCLACQRLSGSVFAVQTSFPRDRVTISGASQTYVRVGDAGSTCTFHFCARCGATVHYDVAERPDTGAIAVGAFAQPEFPAPTYSVYEERMHAWVGLPTGIGHRA
jgi:hypothetical protein